MSADLINCNVAASEHGIESSPDADFEPSHLRTSLPGDGTEGMILPSPVTPSQEQVAKPFESQVGQRFPAKIRSGRWVGGCERAVGVVRRLCLVVAIGGTYGYLSLPN